ncbi:GNAT family N-acetyltransferase [Tabrizicola sp.]|uniref:GNAT family N-acetyltransferase n=1 Tax=Tabrizicola sp. TaxID=2005166 RepID=UPI002602A3E3|nr:GNAT family N-acetyltransferase [Tabrizicola sp.]MDM7932739.1 GNAT family N-acetyltransferase [Tabrizicola sp.]
MTDSLADTGVRGGAPGGQARTIAVHHDWKALEPDWRKLEEDGHATVFQTYDWASAWYANTSKHGLAKPLIVTVADAGGIVWILPLCRHRWKGMNFISLADLGVSDYGGVVMARDDRISSAEVPGVMSDILRALPRCDMVHFQKLQQQIEGKPNPLLQVGHVVAMRESCYGIDVRRPWGELSKEIMQSRLRSTIRQQKKKIAAIGPISLEHVSDPQSIGSAMDALFKMRRGRFERIGRPDTPEVWRSFYSDVARNPERTLDVCVTTMRVADTPVAVSFGLTRGKAYHSVMPTFAAEEWEAYRPGMLMFDAMLEEYGPRMGFEGYFDFTIGDEPYKQRFGAIGQPLMECMSPRSLKGALAFLYWRAKAARRHRPTKGAEGNE